jgi:hypothetical protein
MTMIPRAAVRGIRSSSSSSSSGPGSLRVMAQVNRIAGGSGVGVGVVARSDRTTVALRRSFLTSTPRLSSNGKAPQPRVPPPAAASATSASATSTSAKQSLHAQKSTAGTGHGKETVPGAYARTKDRGPVSWPSLFLVTIAAASAVAYYRVERERRLESAMGKVVSSESDGWSPRPDYLAKRKFKATKWGWFPVEDGFGARESMKSEGSC